MSETLPTQRHDRRHPDFAPGNDAGLRHGAYRNLSDDPEVAEYCEWIRDTQPLSHPADSGAVQRLGTVYKRIRISATALDKADQFVADNPLAAYADQASWLANLREDHLRWIREAGRIEAELGRTPASRAKLGLHMSLASQALTVVDLHRAAAAEAAALGEKT